MPKLVTYRPAEWQRLNPMPGPGTYRFLANGDSWFSIGAIPPTETANLLKAMEFDTDTCAVDFSQPGAEAGQMWGVEPTSTWAYNPQFTGMLNGGPLAYKWDGILLSAGGNDFIAAVLTPVVDADGKPVPPESRLLLQPSEWSSQADVSRYVSEAGWKKFDTYLTAVFGDLIAMRDDSTSQSQGVPVFLHSYCYVQPRNVGVGAFLGGKWTGGPWLFKAVGQYSIPPDQWLSLTEYLMDRLFALLTRISSEHTNIHVLDFRKALAPAQAGSNGVSGEWQNEIHPTNDGYARLGALYSQAVKAVISGDTSIVTPPTIERVLMKPPPDIAKSSSTWPAPASIVRTRTSTARRVAGRN